MHNLFSSPSELMKYRYSALGGFLTNLFFKNIIDQLISGLFSCTVKRYGCFEIIIWKIFCENG